MALRGINHVALKVRSLAAADGFYGRVLGMELVGERPGMRFYRAGGHLHDLALVEAPELTARGGALFHFCLDVSDAEALKTLHDRCKAEGVQVLGAVDHGISRGFYVRDPDGNVVELAMDATAERLAELGDEAFAEDVPIRL